MSAMVYGSQITGVSIVCSTICSGAEQRKHQSSALLAFVMGNYRWPGLCLFRDQPHSRFTRNSNSMAKSFCSNFDYLGTFLQWNRITATLSMTNEISRQPGIAPWAIKSRWKYDMVLSKITRRSINTMGPKRDACHFANDIVKGIFLNSKVNSQQSNRQWVLIDPGNRLAGWRRKGSKPWR